MKVALVSEHASPLAILGGDDAGGQNVHVAALAEGLARRGNTVTVHTRREDPSVPTTVRCGRGVVVHHVDAGPASVVPKDEVWQHMPVFAERLADEWRLDPPDVVHAHFWMSGWASLRAAAAVSPLPPVLQTFHALGVVKHRHQAGADTSPPQRLRVEQDLARGVDAVVATCSDEVFELRRMADPTAPLHVVPCGVDLEHFRPTGERLPRTQRYRLLVVGRLVRRKGLPEVLQALAQLVAEGLDVELVVAGGPACDQLGADPTVTGLRQQARGLGVADRLVLLGRVPREQLPALYRSADLVVCAPWYEPFGIVPLEAMACGVPVVVSAVGGLVDSVVDGATGLHVPPRDPVRLADALGGLLLDGPRRHRMSQEAVARARTRYGWDRVAAATESVYTALVADCRRDRSEVLS